jgi:thymidylate synthase (FAD)
MNVTLLQHTPEPELTVALAARLCYSPASILELRQKLTAADIESFLDKIMSLGHLSVLEHVSFTFGVEGISRATSHQLVRHRLASYSQQSQRYVSLRDSFETVVPATIANEPALKERFEGMLADIHACYAEMVAAGVPAEDARYILPNAAATKILVTMNARELRHFFELRCCERAQWEIRAMASEMLQQVKNIAPVIFRNAGPGCIAGPCPEGTLTCGKIVEVRSRFR